MGIAGLEIADCGLAKGACGPGIGVSVSRTGAVPGRRELAIVGFGCTLFESETHVEVFEVSAAHFEDLLGGRGWFVVEGVIVRDEAEVVEKTCDLLKGLHGGGTIAVIDEFVSVGNVALGAPGEGKPDDASDFGLHGVVGGTHQCGDAT